jgi:hypothetical protein
MGINHERCVAVAEHLHAAGFAVRWIVPRFPPYPVRGVLPPSPLLTRPTCVSRRWGGCSASSSRRPSLSAGAPDPRRPAR